MDFALPHFKDGKLCTGWEGLGRRKTTHPKDFIYEPKGKWIIVILYGADGAFI